MKAISTTSPLKEHLRNKQNAILAIISGLTVIFLSLAENLLQGKSFSWDAPFMLKVHSFSQPWLDFIMVDITHTGGTLVALSFALCLYWLHKAEKRDLFWGTAISFLGAVSINSFLKLLFARPRPAVFPPLTAVYTYSFPSGHTVAAISLYGFLAFALWQMGKKWQAVLSATWVLLIALSRIYLGVHYPSDVIGALAFGGIWLFGVIYWILLPKSKENNLRRL